MSAEDANYVYCTNIACGFGITYAQHKQMRYALGCPWCYRAYQFGPRTCSWRRPDAGHATHIKIDGARVYVGSKLYDSRSGRLFEICGDLCENYEGRPSLPATVLGWPDGAPIPIADLEWTPPVVDITVRFED